MSSEYKPKFLDIDDKKLLKRESSGIFKSKLKIALVAIIAFQGYTYINKKQAMQSAESGYQAQQPSGGFTSTAFADIPEGQPLNIPYSPNMGNATSNQAQMQAAAQAEAQRMMQTGDVAAFQEQLRSNPMIAKIAGSY